MEIRHQLRDQLKRLKMPGLWQALDVRLSEATANNLGHLEFLSLLVQDELVNREDNMLSKRLKAAGFGVQKSFEDFDYRFNEEALPASVLRDLATCHFISQKQNLVIGGPPGIGKSSAAMKDRSATDLPEPMGPEMRRISSDSTPRESMATALASDGERNASGLSKSLSKGIRRKP